MGCREFKHLLPMCSDACDDTCLSEKEYQRLQAHLSECPACAQEAELYCKMVTLVKQTGAVECPGDLPERVLRRLREEPGARSRRTFWAWPSFALGSVVTAAAVLMIMLVRPQAPVVPTLPVPAGGQTAVNTVPQRTRTAAREVRQRVADLPLPRRMTLMPRILAPSPQFTRFAPGFAAERAALSGFGGGMVVDQWTGEHSAVKKPEVFVARTPAECQSLWERSGISPIPETATLRWGEEMLVAIFLGELPGSGYAVHLVNVQNAGPQLNLGYRLTGPDPDTEAHGSSQPYLLAVLGATSLPVAAQLRE